MIARMPQKTLDALMTPEEQEAFKASLAQQPRRWPTRVPLGIPSLSVSAGKTERVSVRWDGPGPFHAQRCVVVAIPAAALKIRFIWKDTELSGEAESFATHVQPKLVDVAMAKGDMLTVEAENPCSFDVQVMTTVLGEAPELTPKVLPPEEATALRALVQDAERSRGSS